MLTPSRSDKQVGARRAGHQPAAVVALDQRRLVVFAIVRESAGERGEDAPRRDDAVEMAIFIVDERERHVGRAQHDERVHRVHQVGDDRRGACELAQG